MQQRSRNLFTTLAAAGSAAAASNMEDAVVFLEVRSRLVPPALRRSSARTQTVLHS